MIRQNDLVFPTNDPPNVSQLLTRGIGRLDLGGYLFCHAARSVTEALLYPNASNLQSRIIKDYFESGVAEFDPIARLAETGTAPVAWTIGNGGSPELPGPFLNFARRHGVRGGVVIPLLEPKGRRTLLILTSTRDLTHPARDLLPAAGLLAIAARNLHVTAQIMTKPFEDQPMRGLSMRQRQVAHWISEGKSNPEICKIMGLTIKQVKYDIAMMMVALGVTSRAQVASIYASHIGRGTSTSATDPAP